MGVPVGNVGEVAGKGERTGLVQQSLRRLLPRFADLTHELELLVGGRRRRDECNDEDLRRNAGGKTGKDHVQPPQIVHRKERRERE
jgi:hypothetical protein